MNVADQIATETPKNSEFGLIFPLELVRFLAAVAVFIVHFAEYSKLSFLLRFSKVGELPVVIFFILSGFVIGLRHQSRREGFGSYARARLIRLFPIYSIVLAGTGLMLLDPIFRGAVPLGQLGYQTLLGNIGMLQGPKFMNVGGCFSPWVGNGPLWTLSIEFWFYAIYGFLHQLLSINWLRIIVLGFGVCSLFLLAKTSLFVFLVPTLFPIWWSGVELAHQFIANRRLSWKDSWFAILSLTVLACLKPLFLIHPLSGRDSQLVDIRLVENLFVFGLGIISVALIAQNWIFLSRKWNRNSVRTLGSSSYALYLIHFPILMFVSVHGGGVLGLLAVLPVSLTIAICLETVFHRKISGFLKRKLVLA